MRALLSVYDKTGIVDLARQLRGLGWDLISSGGTAATLREADLAVTDVADLTGTPAILGHRVVTLHPKVHGGILADRRNPDHQKDLVEHGIDSVSVSPDSFLAVKRIVAAAEAGRGSRARKAAL